jgi:thymidylate synthase
MNKLDAQYKNILSEIGTVGEWEDNRTGIRAKTIPSAMIRHNMSEGFPLLTIKRVPFRVMAVELEGFIKGINSKKWFQDRDCHIWDQWCNPQKVPYGNDDETKQKMLEEDDLGLIYGSMWRDFHVPNAVENYGAEGGFYRSGGIDQLKNIIYTLQKNPQDRRMICSAWNPLALNFQALPPCHVLFQVSVINNKLNLTWFQRSCDILLGIPFNIASYGLLLHLFAKFYGFEEGTLTGFLNNVHIYENQLDGFNEIMSREPNFDLPTVSTDTRYGNLLTWEYRDTTLNDYKCLPTVKMPVAI